MTTSKSELRRLIRDRERSLPEEELRARDGELVKKLLALPEFKSAGCVLLYFGTGTEIDTRPVIRRSLEAGKTVALPRITGPGTMVAGRILSQSQLVPGAYGIPEPPEDAEILDPGAFGLILVPGVAFSPEGRRLGRGGGYYDRYLADTRGLKVALVRDLQLTPHLPAGPHDIDVDLIITG